MKKQIEYKIICAWCQKPMGTKMGEGNLSTGNISHSICGLCKEKILKQLNKEETK